MIYSSWDIEQNILKLVILGYFLLFYPLKTLKIKILKNEKFCWRYHHFKLVYQKSQSCELWFLRYRVWQTEFFVILDSFLPFYPPMDPKNQNFKKMKKTSKDIIILYMCTINGSHMMCGSWDMECNEQNFLSFLDSFSPFYPPNNPKNQNFERKWKNYLEILSFYTGVTQITITWWMDPEIPSVSEFLSIWTFFALSCP